MINNSTCINVLKVLAAAMVFGCHAWIVCHDAYGLVFSDWKRLLVTPAWAGVWIFLILGGYLAASGFFGGRYNLDKKGILTYYYGRLVKILIPTWVFISLEYVLVYPDVTINFDSILLALSCTFFGTADVYMPGIGASWYVFIIFILYLLAPWFVLLLKRLEKGWQGKEARSCLFLMIGICLAGGLYRVLGYFLHWDWYKWSYANVLACADLFFAGICACRIKAFLPEWREKTVIMIRRVTIACLTLLVIFCLDFGSLIPYGEILYRYVWPSAFLVLTCLLLVAYDFTTGRDQERVERSKSQGRFFNIVAPYTFMFYLWHSSLLGYVVSKVQVEGEFAHYILTFVLGLVLTSYVAFLMTKMTNGITKTLLKKK